MQAVVTLDPRALERTRTRRERSAPAPKAPRKGAKAAAAPAPGQEPAAKPRDLHAELERISVEHRGRLKAAAIRILRDPEDAEDAVQDGLLSAWRKVDTFRGDAQLSTWLHQIVVNASLMRLRSRKRRAEVPFELTPSVASAEIPRDAEAVLVARQLGRRALAKADELSPAHREILYERYAHDTPYEELAKQFEISVGGAKARLHRARAALHDLVEDSPIESDDEAKSGA